MLAAGLLLGAVALRTRSAWAAVGLHAGWNAVYGGRLVDVAPAETEPAAALLRLELREAPVVLTGGGASLGSAPVTTVLLLAGAAAVWWRLDPAPGGPA